MKKSIFLSAAALILALAVAGCSSPFGDKGSSDNSANTTAGTNSEKEEQEMIDNLNADADKNVDMDKVEGVEAQTVDDSSAKGEVGNTEVEITDAKVIDYGGSKVLVVSYDFTNKTGEETTFNMVEDTNATQNGEILPFAIVLDVEGIDTNTLGQRVKNGKTITVQKAFTLANETDDVTVTVNDASAVSDTAPVSKTFKIS